MTTGSILFAAALLLVVGIYLARPILAAANARPSRRRRTSRRQELLLQKEALLIQIRALDFDHDTGKVFDTVYEAQRKALTTEAAAVLKELDALQDRTTPDSGVDLDGSIEAAIASRRQAAEPAPATAPAASAPVTAKNNGHAHTPVKGGSQFCSQCGQPTDASDKFCAHCGHKLIQTKST